MKSPRTSPKRRSRKIANKDALKGTKFIGNSSQIISMYSILTIHYFEGKINVALITINGVSFDPIADAQAFSLAGLESADAEASDYILIQTTAPLSPDQTDELSQFDIVVQEYMSDNTYLYNYNRTDLTSIRSLPF